MLAIFIGVLFSLYVIHVFINVLCKQWIVNKYAWYAYSLYAHSLDKSRQASHLMLCIVFSKHIFTDNTTSYYSYLFHYVLNRCFNKMFNVFAYKDLIKLVMHKHDVV